MTLLLEVIIIIFSFLLFALIHSLLASLKLKRKLIEEAGNLIAFYRLTYNLIALFSFYLLYEILPRPDILIYDLTSPYDLLILIPQAFALIGVLWTFRYFSLGEFSGINQIARWFKGNYNINEVDEKMTLKISGPYKLVRHPLYLFTILFFLFRPVMDLFYLLFIIFLITYFYIGSRYEEKKLIEIFGEEYKQYMLRVPRIIPVKL